MPTAEFLRQKAQEIRALIAVAKTPEVVAQLKIWARDLEEEAAQAESLEPPPLTQSSRQSDGRRNKRRRKAA